MESQANILINRIEYTDEATIGELLIDGIFQCHTLEDTCRRRDKNGDNILQAEEKVYAETAIPAGRYSTKLDVSSRFGFCPFINDVPHFEEVRIHWGNTKVDTKGCILVGHYDPKAPNFVAASRDAFAALMRKLVMLEPRGLITVVQGGYEARV